MRAYRDPTADAAIANVAREEKRKRTREVRARRLSPRNVRGGDYGKRIRKGR